jgi:hypothetical protein
MSSDNEAEQWTITCQCKQTVLQARGEPIQVAICHCADCRKAQGGKHATENLVLMRRDQIVSDLAELKVLPAEEFNDQVPRYFCASCDSCLVGDCTPVGFNMVIVPTVCISADANIHKPDYHMHLAEGITKPDTDGLPQYQGNPEDPHMAALIEGCA